MAYIRRSLRKPDRGNVPLFDANIEGCSPSLEVLYENAAKVTEVHRGIAVQLRGSDWKDDIMNWRPRCCVSHIGLACLASLLVLCGCREESQPKREANPAPSQPVRMDRVVLAQNFVPHSALPIIAKHNGFFQDAGLEVDVRSFTTGKLCFDAMLGGGAEFATVAETPVMYAGFSRQPVKVVATIACSTQSVKILARADKGVSSPDDLRGKRIGTFKGGSAEYFLSRFLEKHGMGLSDCQVTYLAPPELVAAVSRGDLAAIAMWEPHIFQAKKSVGANAIVFSDPGLYTETFNIVIKQSLAEEHPERVLGFLEGLRKAQEYLDLHPGEGKEIVRSNLAVESDVLDAIWPLFEFRLTLKESILQQIEREANFAIKTGAVKAGSAIPDYRSMFASNFLRSIDSSCVDMK